MAKKGAKLISIEKSIDPLRLMEEFLLYKKLKGISKYTMSSYKSAITNFLNGYKGNIQDEKKVKHSVEMFLLGRNNGYYNKLLQALRQYFDYCIGEGVIKSNPCESLRHKRESTRIVQHDIETIKRLLLLPDKTTFAGLRDYTLMLLMLDTGIRPSEALRLTLNDMDFINRQVYVRAQYSKTKQPRDLPISIQTLIFIKKVIESRHEDWAKNTPVFCSFSGNELSTHNLQEKFKGYSKKLGVSITPYHLRHTFALWFLRNGGNVFALQKMMGHSKLDMTQTYVSLVQADITNNHAKASPINSLLAVQKRLGKI